MQNRCTRSESFTDTVPMIGYIASNGDAPWRMSDYNFERTFTVAQFSWSRPVVPMREHTANNRFSQQSPFIPIVC